MRQRFRNILRRFFQREESSCTPKIRNLCHCYTVESSNVEFAEQLGWSSELALSRDIACSNMYIAIRGTDAAERRRNGEQGRAAMKRVERREKERKKKIKEPIRLKREAKPWNRAIKALLLASDRAAREAHCFEFETSVRSERSRPDPTH